MNKRVSELGPFERTELRSAGLAIALGDEPRQVREAALEVALSDDLQAAVDRYAEALNQAEEDQVMATNRKEAELELVISRAKLRDHFAGKALVGLLSSTPYERDSEKIPFDRFAIAAYRLADAMLEARGKA